MNVVQALKVLGVERNSSQEQIKSAYRKLVLKHHPDRTNGDSSIFHQVTEAYHTLTNKSDSKEDQSDNRPPNHTTQSRAKWGAGPTDGPPEEDWGRYTKEFEQDEKWWKKYEEWFWGEYETHIKGGNERAKAQEPEEQPFLKLRVDQSLCIGCCSCETLAPDVFELNHNVKSNPKSRVKNPQGAGVNLIMNAAETCPTKAIIVDDIQTGQRLYPL